MAISTYTELKTACANWLARADLTSRIPEFIALCEARFHRQLRLRVQEQRATVSTSSEYTALPSLFLEARNFQLNTTPVTQLSPMAPAMGDTLYAGQTGQPIAYAIVGNEIQLFPAPDGSYTLEMDYYEKFDALSDTTTTNWLLANAPDVYLAGSVVEGLDHIRAPVERIARWENKYKTAIAELQIESDRAVFSGGPLQMRTARVY